MFLVILGYYEVLNTIIEMLRLINIFFIFCPLWLIYVP